MTKNMLIVVDMQNDFIDGSLGTPEALETVGPVCAEIGKNYDEILVTLDTHEENYLETREGRNLPVPHCIRETRGWQIRPEVNEALEKSGTKVTRFLKPTFGSTDLAEYLKQMKENIGSITLTGLCTDICVISNALLIKAALPEVKIDFVETATAGVTPEKKEAAIEVLKSCQIFAKEEL